MMFPRSTPTRIDPRLLQRCLSPPLALILSAWTNGRETQPPPMESLGNLQGDVRQYLRNLKIEKTRAAHDE